MNFLSIFYMRQGFITHTKYQMKFILSVLLSSYKIIIFICFRKDSIIMNILYKLFYFSNSHWFLNELFIKNGFNQFFLIFLKIPSDSEMVQLWKHIKNILVLVVFDHLYDAIYLAFFLEDYLTFIYLLPSWWVCHNWINDLKFDSSHNPDPVVHIWQNL
jgi:hypothetical protein